MSVQIKQFILQRETILPKIKKKTLFVFLFLQWKSASQWFKRGRRKKYVRIKINCCPTPLLKKTKKNNQWLLKFFKDEIPESAEIIWILHFGFSKFKSVNFNINQHFSSCTEFKLQKLFSVATDIMQFIKT